MLRLNPRPLVDGTPVDSIPTRLSELNPILSGSMLSTHFLSIATLFATRLSRAPLIKKLSENKTKIVAKCDLTEFPEASIINDGLYKCL
jgi:hypothetical protein